VSAAGRFRLLGPVLLMWLAVTALTVGPYVVAFALGSPQWTEVYFTPLAFICLPAWSLAYAVAHSDFPMIQFGIFVVIENLLIAILLVGIGRLVRRWRAAAPNRM